MTDPEIKRYLENRNLSVKANDAIIDIFNTSPQITDKKYDFENHKMTIITPENVFTFIWVLGCP